MSGSEKEAELKSSDSAVNNVEGHSEGGAEVYIDPVKENKMMRKFDVSRRRFYLHVTMNSANSLIVLVHWVDGAFLSHGKSGSVRLGVTHLNFIELI